MEGVKWQDKIKKKEEILKQSAGNEKIVVLCDWKQEEKLEWILYDWKIFTYWLMHWKKGWIEREKTVQMIDGIDRQRIEIIYRENTCQIAEHHW